MVQFEYDADMALARNEQVEPPIVVVVAPGGASPVDARPISRGGVVESPPSIVVVEPDQSKIRDRAPRRYNIEAAIVVIIGPGDGAVIETRHTGRGSVVEG